MALRRTLHLSLGIHCPNMPVNPGAPIHYSIDTMVMNSQSVIWWCFTTACTPLRRIVQPVCGFQGRLHHRVILGLGSLFSLWQSLEKLQGPAL